MDLKFRVYARSLVIFEPEKPASPSSPNRYRERIGYHTDVRNNRPSLSKKFHTPILLFSIRIAFYLLAPHQRLEGKTQASNQALWTLPKSPARQDPASPRKFQGKKYRLLFLFHSARLATYLSCQYLTSFSLAPQVVTSMWARWSFWSMIRDFPKVPDMSTESAGLS